MELVERKLDTTVNNALRESRLAILPEIIRNDSSVRWILSFDKFGRKSQNNEYWRGDDDYGRSFIAPIIQSTLTPNISFYFASIFYIGRLWSTAEQSIQVLNNSLKPENLAETSKLNSHWLKSRLDESESLKDDYFPTLIPEAFTEILKNAQLQFEDRLSKSKEYWDLWRREVNSLNELVEKSSREYNEGRYNNDRRGRSPFEFSFFPPSVIALSSFSYQANHLYHLLSENGIQFNITSTPAPAMGWLSLLPQILMSGRGGDEYRDMMREIRQLVERQIHLLEEQRDGPVIEAIQKRLLQQFNGEDPFYDYRILAFPPDERLKELWDMCKMPGNKMFFYAQKWIDSLESAPSFYSSELAFIDFQDEEVDDSITSYCSSADSTIKRKWVTANRTAGETPRHLIQSLFEKEWIVAIVKGAVYPVKSKKGTQKWDIRTFEKLLVKIVTNLNSKGYELSTPELLRLEKLWKLAMEDKIYGETW